LPLYASDTCHDRLRQALVGKEVLTRITIGGKTNMAKVIKDGRWEEISDSVDTLVYTNPLVTEYKVGWKTRADEIVSAFPPNTELQIIWIEETNNALGLGLADAAHKSAILRIVMSEDWTQECNLNDVLHAAEQVLTFRDAVHVQAAQLVGSKVGDQSKAVDQRPSFGVYFEGDTTKVDFVIEGGPADNGKVAKGDTLLTINGHAVTNSTSAIHAISDLKPGDTIHVKFLHNAAEMVSSITLMDMISVYGVLLDAQAAKGDSYAEFMLGQSYFFGNGRTIDHDRAIRWLTKSADQGSVPAGLLLASAYAGLSGKSADIPSNYDEAIKYLRHAAEQGDTKGQNGLAFLTESGYGTPQDCKAAFDLYGKASSAGSAEATFNLGTFYLLGVCGVPKNVQRAIDYYTNSAEHGIAAAEVSLAYIYDVGLGVPRNENQAIIWYRKAAEGGIPFAQNNLGYHLAKTNEDEAEHMFGVAAAKGDSRSKYNLDCMKNHDPYGGPQCGPSPDRCVRNDTERDFDSALCYESLDNQLQYLRAALGTSSTTPSLFTVFYGYCGIPTSGAMPQFPILARELQIGGNAEVQFDVDNGVIGRLQILSGGNPVLNKAVQEAVKGWTFAPCKSEARYTSTVSFAFNSLSTEVQDPDAYSSALQCYNTAGSSEVIKPSNANWCAKGFKQAYVDFHERGEKGDADSLAKIAFMYEHGQGMDVNSVEAFHSYSRAAELGDPSAIYRMGHYYDDGDQVSPDKKQAFMLYLRAANKGYAPAAFRVAVMTENGIGAVRDASEAIKWYRQCGEMADAKSALARLVPNKIAFPDGAAKAAARRSYAELLGDRMRRSLKSDPNADPTLVQLNVRTITPKSLTGDTREDYRLVIETNTVTLPRDVTKILRQYSLNGKLYELGFREVSIQDTIGERMGTILCAIDLTAAGALPRYCMRVESTRFGYEEGVLGAGWQEYYRWPSNYSVGDAGNGGGH